MSEHCRTWLVSSSDPLLPRKARIHVADVLSLNPFLVGLDTTVSNNDSRLFVVELDADVCPKCTDRLHFHETDSTLAGLILGEAHRFESLVSAFFEHDEPTAFYVGRPLLLSAEVSRHHCALIEFSSQAWDMYRMTDRIDRSTAFHCYLATQRWIRSLANHLDVPVSSTPGCVLSMAAGGSLSS